MTSDSLEAFVRGMAFRDRNFPVDEVVKLIRCVYRGADLVRSRRPTDEERNRMVAKIAALGVAFYREVQDVLDGKFELDFRDQAILDAVVDHLSRGTS